MCDEGEEEHGGNKGAVETKKRMRERPRHQPEVIHYTSDTHIHLPPPPPPLPSLLLLLSSLFLISPFFLCMLFFTLCFLFSLDFFLSSFAVLFLHGLRSKHLPPTTFLKKLKHFNQVLVQKNNNFNTSVSEICVEQQIIFFWQASHMSSSSSSCESHLS